MISPSTKKILVIKEKSGHDTKGWKIPGGLVDVGEFLYEAVVREVKEETGISAVFKGIVGMREKKPYHFGRNDIYFIALLEPENEEIVKCEFEVDRCEWLDIEEFCKFEHRVETQKRVAGLAKKICGFIDDGVGLDDMVWRLEHAKTNLETLKYNHPIYHSKL